MFFLALSQNDLLTSFDQTWHLNGKIIELGRVIFQPCLIACCFFKAESFLVIETDTLKIGARCGFSNPWGFPLPHSRHPYDMFDFGGIQTANQVYVPFMVWSTYCTYIATCFWILLPHPSVDIWRFLKWECPYTF